MLFMLDSLLTDFWTFVSGFVTGVLFITIAIISIEAPDRKENKP